MAEEVLIAELRAATSKFDQDLKKATQASDRASKEISDALNGINDSVKDLPKAFKEFNDGLKASEAAAKKAAGGMGHAFRGLNTLIKGTVIGAVAAVGVALVKLGADGFRASQSLEASERQLRQITGSSAAAAKEMAYIRAETERLGLSTAEGAKGFAQIAIAAQGTVAEGEGVRQIFSAINEITAANNLTQEQYTTLLQQTTQGINKQKFELDDLKSISEAGVPIFQTMIKTFNTTPDKLFKAISDGKIGVKELMVTMQQLRKEQGAWAEEAANTIPAKIRGGFSKLTTGIADIFRGIFSSKELNDLFSDLTSGLDFKLPSKEDVSKFVDDVVGSFRDMLAIVATIFEAMISVIKKAWQNAVDWIRDQTTKIGSHFKEGSELIGKLWDKTLGGWFNKASDTVGNAAGKIVDTVDETVNKIGPGLLWSALGVEEGKEPQSLKELDAALRKAAGLQAKANEDAKKNEEALTEAQKKELDKREKDLAKYYEDQEKRRKESSEGINTAGDEKEAKKRLAAQEKEIKEQIKNYRAFLKVLADLDKKRSEQLQKDLDRDNEARQEREAEVAKVLEEQQKTYDNMKENVQETLSGLISDSIKGDIGNIKDMLDNVLDLFASFAAEAASKFVIDAVFDDAVNFLMGPLNKETGKRSGGFLSTQIPGGQGGIGTVGGAASVLGAGFAGGQVGGAIGGRFGGKTGSIAGGVLGGAAAGAAMGAVIGGGVLSIPAAAIGAVAGAVVGGITSAIQAGAFSSPKKSSLGVQTGAQLPGDIRGDSFRRSPFGFLTVFEEASASDDLIASALTLISETDRAIASHLDTRQREIVDNYFKTAIPDGNIVRAEADDDAIAKLVAQRYYQAITAIAGQDIAENVVGSPFGATKGSIGTIQQRANAALALLKQIEEFRIGPITETASAIKAINEQFQALIDQATTLGIPTDEIIAEQQRQLAEITTNFNQNITDSILAIKDPVAAEYAALEREQEERRKNAVDAEADLTALAELETLEREELAKRLNQATDGTGAATDALMQRLQAFQNQGLSGASQSILALQTTFVQLRDEMTAAGLSTTALTAAYQQQAAAIRHQAQEQVLGALYAITNPFQAAMLSMGAQVREFQKLVAEGIIPQSTLDAYVQAATEQARYQEAIRLASGQGSAADQFQDMVDAFTANTRPLSDAEREIQRITQEFENLAAALQSLGVPTDRLEAHRDAQIAAVKAEEAQRKKEEAERKREEARQEAERKKQEAERKREEARQKAEQRRQEIASYKDSRTSFINAARSDAYQQLQQLAKSYRELIAEGKRLGQSTAGITKSYKAQAAEIRTSARESVLSALYGITDPFKASMMQIAQQVRDFQQLARDGIVSSKTVRQFQREAIKQAREQEQERRLAARESVLSALYGMTDPFAASLLSMNQQVREFQKIAEEGLIPKKTVAQFKRLAFGQAGIDRAQQLIGGGPQTGLETIGDAFRSFIEASNPISDAAQRMRELNNQFKGLHSAAGVLRLDSRELMRSYQQQARVIREEAIKAIDDQLQAQRDQIDSIDDYLKQLRVGEDLPSHMRLDESRQQFLAAVRSGDIDEALSTAESYRSLARERFGGTESFFSAKAEVERILGGLQEQQRARLDQERNRLIRQEDRDLQRIAMERTSLDHLRQVRGDTSEMARSLREMLVISRQQAASTARQEVYIRRVMNQQRA